LHVKTPFRRAGLLLTTKSWRASQATVHCELRASVAPQLPALMPTMDVRMDERAHGDGEDTAAGMKAFQELGGVQSTNALKTVLSIIAAAAPRPAEAH
jgi:hypothetical protein